MIQFNIPSLPALKGLYLLVAERDGASQHLIYSWAVTMDRNIVAVTAGGDFLVGSTNAILYQSGRISSCAGEFRSAVDWLSAVRERWEAADAETTAALLAAREERG